MDGRSMTEALSRQRQQMRLDRKKELLRWFHQQLDTIDIYAERYSDSMSAYIKTRQDVHVQDMDEAREQVILGVHELKLKERSHPQELNELVTQAVALFEELIGVNLSLEERAAKYKRDNNTLQARLMGLIWRRHPKTDFTQVEHLRFGLWPGQRRMGRE
ncbi:uncharacterized protein EAE97_007058 [Botrytis byssoidea]|uniref:Uncharacterized protein n=1 Tax=Botrytis byssoidea TaxID=139641 RepID=A0A9P5IHG5_9HELO|nr:uncharacterized protein EAE97_007058 [Botrytis byssoidea]KAF7940873.1 hypothetical protein EAE97_007058 [Botrytis byssoidea]